MPGLECSSRHAALPLYIDLMAASWHATSSRFIAMHMVIWGQH
jgi:hypothetical protein